MRMPVWMHACGYECIYVCVVCVKARLQEAAVGEPEGGRSAVGVCEVGGGGVAPSESKEEKGASSVRILAAIGSELELEIDSAAAEDFSATGGGGVLRARRSLSMLEPG